MSKIALAMICGAGEGEEKKLNRALSSARQYVDDIFVTFTKPEEQCGECIEIAKKYDVKISYGTFNKTIDQKTIKWLNKFLKHKPETHAGDSLFMFHEARNFNYSQIPQEYDWILWIDCDDVLRRGDNLRTLADQGIEKGVEAYYFNYIYHAEFNEDGSIRSVLIQHLRERLTKNTHGVFKWVAPIHETLIEQRDTIKCDSDACDVLHLSSDEDKFKSLTRNLKNLEYAVYESQGKDPRHLYYLAKAYIDLHNEDKDASAMNLIMMYLTGENKSGWPEERREAWEYLAELYRRKGEHNNAVKACMNSLIEVPDFPSVYLNLALTYVYMQQWETALFWVKIASTVADKKTTLVSNPKDLQTRTLEVIYNCSLQLHRIDEAWAAATKLIELHPEHQGVKENYNMINNVRSEREITKKILELSQVLEQTGEYPKIKALLAASPQMIQSNPFYINLYQKHNPPHAWESDEIAIYCGPGFTPWGPRYMKDPKGTFMGGSEEAVVLVSEALVKKGWRVTVYNDCGEDEGEHNGVAYLPYYKFNRSDNFNILIGWRDIRLFDTKFSAKKTYLWCHDIQSPLDFTEDRLKNITRVMFLSQWHRDNVPDLSESQVFLTTNGI